MKTLLDVLKQIVADSQDSNLISTNTKAYNVVKTLLNQGSMFINTYRSTRGECARESLSDSIDKVLDAVAKVNDHAPDRDTIYQVYTVKYFLEADEESKAKMLSDHSFVSALSNSKQYINRFIPCKDWGKIVKILLEKGIICNLSIFDAMHLIEDFDNVTDDQIRVIYGACHDTRNFSYSVAIYLFGEDRVIPLIIEDINKCAKENENDIVVSKGDDYNLTGDDRIKILTKLSNEAVEKIRLNIPIEEFVTLCKADSRYLICNNYSNDYGNAMWEDKELPDIIRYCMVIGKCCANGAIPSYQLNKIKLFAPLVQMMGYNYRNIFKAIKDSFDEKGMLKEEIIAASKVKPNNNKTEQIYFVTIKDGNIQIFKSKEERDNAHIEGGINYDYTKSQLRKKMNELLEN